MRSGKMTFEDKSGFSLHFLFGILILALLVALLFSTNQPKNLWLLSVPLILFVVMKSNLWTLILITVIVFFGNWLIDLTLLPPQIMWGREILILLLLVKAIARKMLTKTKVVFTGGWIFLAFFLVNLVSFYINRSGSINMLLFIRLVFDSYLLFLAVINLEIEEKELKIYTYCLLGLIIIQLPVAFIKMLVYGQGEQAIGTYDYHGGTLSTVLPLVVIGFGLAFYLVYNKGLLFIGLVLGSVAFAIIGGKRGFIFFLPAVLIFISWYLKDDIRHLFKYALIGGVIFLAALYFALSLIPTLSPGRTERSDFDLKYAISFATNYTTKQSQGLTWGRTTTSINVFQNLSSRGSLPFLFGTGPGSVMKSRFDAFDTRRRLMEEFNVGYGITGLTYVAMNAGYLGAFLIFLLIYVIMRKCAAYFRKEKEPFWRAFGLSLVVFSFILIFINVIYAPVMIDDLLSTLYFGLAGFIVVREKKL